MLRILIARLPVDLTQKRRLRNVLFFVFLVGWDGWVFYFDESLPDARLAIVCIRFLVQRSPVAEKSGCKKSLCIQIKNPVFSILHSFSFFRVVVPFQSDPVCCSPILGTGNDCLYSSSAYHRASTVGWRQCFS